MRHLLAAITECAVIYYSYLCTLISQYKIDVSKTLTNIQREN